MALGAPLLTSIDPEEINPVDRLQSPSLEHWFGTEHLGRDIFARALYGGRVSLIGGLCVSTMSTLVGIVIGLLSGYHRRLDVVVMRVMDGLMAIPGILLAIALMALIHALKRPRPCEIGGVFLYRERATTRMYVPSHERRRLTSHRSPALLAATNLPVAHLLPPAAG